MTLSLVSVGATWVVAEPALARCEAINVPIVMAVPNATSPSATESPYPGTCNGNGTYRGILRDARPTDDNCATLALYDFRGGTHYRTLSTCNNVSFPFEESEPDGVLYLVLRAGGSSAGRNSVGY